MANDSFPSWPYLEGLLYPTFEPFESNDRPWDFGGPRFSDKPKYQSPKSQKLSWPVSEKNIPGSWTWPDPGYWGRWNPSPEVPFTSSCCLYIWLHFGRDILIKWRILRGLFLKIHNGHVWNQRPHRIWWFAKLYKLVRIIWFYWMILEFFPTTTQKMKTLETTTQPKFLRGIPRIF
jgi:hypothetical protein